MFVVHCLFALWAFYGLLLHHEYVSVVLTVKPLLAPSLPEGQFHCQQVQRQWSTERFRRTLKNANKSIKCLLVKTMKAVQQSNAEVVPI